MRKYLGSLMVAGILGFIAAPAQADRAKDIEPAAAAVPVAVQRVGLPSTGIRDEAAMILVGTVLIGLAAAVRRAA